METPERESRGAARDWVKGQVVEAQLNREMGERKGQTRIWLSLTLLL